MLGSCAARQAGFKRSACRSAVREEGTQDKQVFPERECDLLRTRLDPAPREMINRVKDLDGVSCTARQRLVHVRDKRDGWQSGGRGNVCEAFREVSRAFERRHEGPAPGLHIHDEALQACRKFLREDRRRDQWDRLHRRRHIPDAIETLVGRCEVCSLSDDGAANLTHGARKEGGFGLRIVTRDAFELVERATRVAKATSGDHGYIGAAGSEHGREHEAHIVANAAGRMLVEHWAIERQSGPVEHLS